MYRTIIVPLDGSARSHTALPLAARLARASNAQLELVRVHLEGRPDLAEDPTWDVMFRDGEMRQLEALAAAYEVPAGRTVGTALLDAPVVEAISAFAASHPAPLIVMATRGRTGLRRALLGSTSDGLVRRGAAPVLVLRDRPDDDEAPLWMHKDPFARIVVPLDGTTFAEAGITHAAAIALSCGSKLHLVRVVGPLVSSAVLSAFATYPLLALDDATIALGDSADEYLQGIVARLNAGWPALEVTSEVALSTDTGKAIIDATRSRSANLVVMATHGRGVSRVLYGAVGDRVLRDGPDAILFIRPAETSVPATLRMPWREARSVRLPPVKVHS